MSKTKKISRRKRGAMVTSIGTLTLVTSGLVSACAVPTTTNPLTDVPITELTPSQINLAPMLVAENFAFDGFDGAGTIRGNVVQALPSGYEYHVQNLRVLPAFVAIDNVNNLQEGDQISIIIVQIANPTQPALPESLTMEVSGLSTELSPIAPIEFSNMLVPQAFAFTGINGLGGIQINAEFNIPSRYEYRISSDRPGQQTPLPIGQIQGLQNGDIITVEIFDTQTQLAYPYVGPIKILVQGLRALDITATLAATTFTFEGVTGSGRMTINSVRLPANFRYEVSRDRTTWLASDALTDLVNNEVFYVRLIGTVDGTTSAIERQVTTTNLTPDKTVSISENANEYITSAAISVDKSDGSMHVNPGYELPSEYTYRIYIKREADGNPFYVWKRPEQVRGLLPDDDISIGIRQTFGSNEWVGNRISLTARSLYKTIPHLQESFFNMQGGLITIDATSDLPPEMQYQFSIGEEWVSLAEINASGGIPVLTSLNVRIVNNADPANPIFTDSISIPWERWYLQPDFFHVSDRGVVVNAPQPLPSGLIYHYWVDDAQGWTSIENVQNIPIGTTIWVKIVGAFDEQVINTNYITIPWEYYYLQPDFFHVSDGEIVVTTPQPLPSGLVYQYWVDDAQGWTSIENVPNNLLMGTNLSVKITGQIGEQIFNTNYIQFPVMP